MPFAGEIYEKSARIGFWNMTESEASLRAGITLSPTSMSLVNRSGSAKRRIELLAVRSLMHRMGISDNDLYYDKNEKPLLHSGRHISISHSGTMACVALSGEPVGVDIQEIKPRLSTVMKWLLKGKKSAVTDESLVHYGILWTAREAMFKLAGRPGHFGPGFRHGTPRRERPQQGNCTGHLPEGDISAEFDIAYRVMDGYVFSAAFHRE